MSLMRNFLFLAALASPCLAEEPLNIEKEEAPQVLEESVVSTYGGEFHAPFTGRVSAKKVRLRLHPDIESPIVKELDRNNLLLVVGEEAEFWEVEAPRDIKAYVFRSYVLDDVIEGSRVNVRLYPDLEAPIVAHLNTGDHVNGDPSSENNRWYEIQAPLSTRFYVAKEYVEDIGPPHIKTEREARHQTFAQEREEIVKLAQEEMQKPFPETDSKKIESAYQKLISEYKEFAEEIISLNQLQTEFQESYINKKIAFLENKNNPEPEPVAEEPQQEFITVQELTEKMKLWKPIEEALYLTWASFNPESEKNQYWEEQKLCSTPLSGIVGQYNSLVKHKPGDYILYDKDVPKAYLYSTNVNLQELVGKKISLFGVPRSNNNFAFPSYFVLSVEE